MSRSVIGGNSPNRARLHKQATGQVEARPTIEQLESKTVDELRALGSEVGVKNVTRYRKAELVLEVLRRV